MELKWIFSLISIIFSYYKLGPLAFVLALGLSFTYFYYNKKKPWPIFVYGLLVLSLLSKPHVTYPPGQLLHIQGQVTRAYDHYPDYQRLEIKDSNTGHKFSVQTKAKDPINVYDKVRGQIEITPTRSYRNFFMYSTEDYYFRSYIGASAREVDLDFKADSSLLVRLRDRLTQKIDKSIEENFSPINQDILKRLILGQTIKDQDIQDLYSSSGLVHLLAVSGLHVSVLVYLIERVLRKLGLAFGPRHMVSGLILIFYAYILAFPPSVTRALLMYFIGLGSESLGIRLSRPNILALAFSLMVLFSPRVIFDLGFQLSFGAIIGLIYLGPDFVEDVDSDLDRALASYLGANIAIFPILVYNFNNFSLLSLALNLIISPIISLVLPLAIIGIGLDLIGLKLGLIFIITNLALDFCTFFIANLMEYFDLNVRIFAPGLAFVLGYYLFIFIVKSGIFDAYIYKNIDLFLCIFGVFFISYLAFQDQALYLGFYDVGQGDSAYIYYKGTYIQVDTGGSIFSGPNPGREVTARAINKRGLVADLLILSHYDADHIGGLRALMDQGLVRSIIAKEADGLEEYEYIKASNFDHYSPKEGESLKIGDDFGLYFFNTEKNIDSNDSSYVILIKFRDKKIFMAGDASSKIEDEFLGLGPVDILKVSHHGSDDSTSQTLVRHMNPSYSVISVGHNSYGHPSPRVLEVLGQSKILRTDQEGEIVFKIDEQIDYISYNNKKDLDPTLLIAGLIGCLMGLVLGRKENSEVFRL